MRVAASRNGSFTLADRKRWAKAPYVVLVDDHSLAEVAVPILAANGRSTASLVATGSPQRFSEEVLIEEVAPQLARAAAAVARTLSHV